MEVDDAALISIDSKGIDIRVRIGAQVFLFSTHLSIISVHLQYLSYRFHNLLCLVLLFSLCVRVVQHAEIIL